MKLICELLDNGIELIQESSEDGRKKYFIEGVFLMGERQNKNGRVYPIGVLEKEVARYTKELIEQKRAYGELNHPSGPSINLDRVSHMIESLRKDGTDYVGRAKITETPMGQIVKGLLDDGANLGVSSRGLGSLKEKNGIMEVQDDFMLATAADIVADPSAHNAFVRGVMENVDWVYDAASGNFMAAERLENTRKEMRRMTTAQINESKLKLFERYLSSLSAKTIL